MIAYYCDRCGKAIVDGTIYRVAITAECISILGTADTFATTFEADAVKARCYCGECKREIKSFFIQWRRRAARRTAGRLESKNA